MGIFAGLRGTRGPAGSAGAAGATGPTGPSFHIVGVHEAPPSNNTRYCSFGSGEIFVDDTSASVVLPQAITITKMYVRTSTAQPAGVTLRILVQRSGFPDTAADLTIAAGSAAGVYATGTINVALPEGDVIWIRVINTGVGVGAFITSISFKLA